MLVRVRGEIHQKLSGALSNFQLLHGLFYLNLPVKPSIIVMVDFLIQKHTKLNHSHFAP